MGRKKLPKNIHILKGTAKKNPKRMHERENEAIDERPLGSPPKLLNKHQKSAWQEIVNHCIQGVLSRSDRLAVEEAARLLVTCRHLDEEDGVIIRPSNGERQLLIKYLSAFGMTPSDRSKIHIPVLKPKSVFDD
jgi:hypothetical protein